MPFTTGVYSRTKTFAIGGANLLPADLNSIQDDLGDAIELQGAHWKNAIIVGGLIFVPGSHPAGTYLLKHDASALTALNQSGNDQSKFYLNPLEDWQVGSFTTQIRLRVSLIQNSVAPAVTFTFGLAKPTGYNIDGDITTISSDIAGTTTAIASPAALNITTTTQTAIDAPSIDYYVVRLTTSGARTAGNSALAMVTLQYRQI